MSETKIAVSALQTSHNQLASHFQRVEAGLAEVAAKQAEVDTEYEELKQVFSAKVSVDSEMTPLERETADKKRKMATGLAASSAAGAGGASSGASGAAGALVGGAASWALVAARPAPSGFLPTASEWRGSALGNSGGGQRKGGSARDGDDLKMRAVLKRLPRVMRDRLPGLAQKLFGFVKDEFVRIQGPSTGTSFSLVLRSDEAAMNILRRHHERPFVGVFE